MGFKCGKANAYHVLKEANARLKEQLAFEKFRPTMEKFAHALGEAMLTKLAATPYNKWPDFAKSTFELVRRDSPTTAHFYKEMLPKE